MFLSTFIIQYYYNFFFFLNILQVVFIIAHYLNKINIIDICMQFIIVTFYDELIINKVL